VAHLRRDPEQETGAGREILVEIRIVVEIHDKYFVLGIAGLDQVQHGLAHRRALGPHGAGIVHHDSDGNRNVLPLEKRYLLRLIVLIDRKICFRQVRHQMPPGVEHHSRQRDFVYLRAKSVSITALGYRADFAAGNLPFRLLSSRLIGRRRSGRFGSSSRWLGNPGWQCRVRRINVCR